MGEDLKSFLGNDLGALLPETSPLADRDTIRNPERFC
jgi:hypothetical protein